MKEVTSICHKNIEEVRESRKPRQKHTFFFCSVKYSIYNCLRNSGLVKFFIMLYLFKNLIAFEKRRAARRIGGQKQGYGQCQLRLLQKGQKG